MLAALAADVGVNVNSRGGTGAAASLRARNSGDGKCRPCVTSLGQSKSIGAYKIAGVEYLNNEKNFRAIAKTKAEFVLIPCLKPALAIPSVPIWKEYKFGSIELR